MATINYASLVLKDKDGNIGTVRTLSQTDIAKINNAVTVTTRSGLPVYSSSVDYEVGFVVRSGTYIYQALVANGPDEPAGAQPVNNGTYWAQIGSVADATTTAKGVVQLADNDAVTAGTAGRVVDAAQLKAAVDTIENITVSGVPVDPSALNAREGVIMPAADLLD